MVDEATKARIIALYREDRLSTTEIATQLGLASKNVVIGVANRWRAIAGVAPKKSSVRVKYDWSDADIARFDARHRSGETWGSVARSLNVSVDTLVFKVKQWRRLHGIKPVRLQRSNLLPLRPSSPKPAAKPLERPVATVRPPPRMVAAPISLLDARAFECRWIVDGYTPAHVCGQPTRSGSSYCPEHHRIVWRPAEKSPHFMPVGFKREVKAA